MNPEPAKQSGGWLILLACHGVYDRNTDVFLADHPEDRKVYRQQLHHALMELDSKAQLDPLLVISGGRTEQTLNQSESSSYLQWAEHLGYDLPTNVVVEEFALTSIENLLLGLYRYHQIRKSNPRVIEIISWQFKATRFHVAWKAIQAWYPGMPAWPALRFVGVGNLVGPACSRALLTEQRYCKTLQTGLSVYYAARETVDLLARRDPWYTREQAREYYGAFPLPF